MKKIIPCLDIKDGRVVKGVNFIDLKDIANPVELARYYSDQGADELIFLDITRTEDGHALMLDTIREVTQSISIPLTVGGGIQSLSDVTNILEAGASKVSVNSAAVKTPDLINHISEQFGSDKLTIAIDTGFDLKTNEYYIYTKGGKQKENLTLFDWARETEKRGAGSLLITSIKHDGVRQGFDIESLNKVSQSVSIPVIASGGAGSIQDFVDLFKKTNVASGLAASIFHKNIVSIPKLKEILVEEGIEVSV